MKHTFLLILACVLPSTIHAADKPAPGGAKAEVAAHDGTWKPTTGVLGGVPLPDATLKAITLKITGDHYEVTVAGEKEPDKGTRALDTSTTPKRITIKSTSGPNRDKKILGIYEMPDADSLRVCYDLSGKEFPKDFKAPQGTQLFLVDYRRQKE